jgi:hypothetical protein
MRLESSLLVTFTAALSLSSHCPASAANLALNLTGEFGPATTLAGAPLGVNTPFSFHAVFDPAHDVNPHPEE